MSLSVAIPESELKDLAVTPVFKWLEVENVPQSERVGYAVMETIEVVEIHIAGRTNCVHTARVSDFCRREGNHYISYAEEYADQYRAFKEGHPQEAQGTPLEVLRQFGVSPAMISLCRSQKIYSVEALHQLEGPALKKLGIEANDLKAACRRYMAERGSKISIIGENREMHAQLEDARRQIEELRASVAAMTGVQQASLGDAAGDAAADSAPDFDAMTDESIKDLIASKAGSRPRGNPKRDTLIQMARELEAA